MSELKLGKLIDTEQQRDAVHVAVAPVVAAERLSPGQHVGFVTSDTKTVGPATHLIGVIDPFLAAGVMKGESCWLFLYPNTVTGMRHHWSHPAFEPVIDDRTASIAWLQAAAVQLGVDYGTLIEENGMLEDGDYINNGEHIRDIWYELQEEFWKHHKIVTGRDVHPDRHGGFTCSC